jgi:hypothetical protein
MTGEVPSGTPVPPAAPPVPGATPAPAPSPTVTPAAIEGEVPSPGSLHIVGRRSWKTWQLLGAIVVAAVFGMWFNGSTGSSTGAAAGSGSSGTYKLPAAKSTTATTAPTSGGATTTTTGAAGAGSATTTTSAADSTSTTTAATVGPPTILVPATQQTGNWTSPAFTIAGGQWDIGWAFQCSPTPTSAPGLEIFAVNAGANPAGTPAVTSSAASGQSVTTLSSTGSQQIVVQSPPGCRWAVKVTGSSS